VILVLVRLEQVGRMILLANDCLKWHKKSIELKCYVFALFSQKEKSATCKACKLLILNVDQPGLEPGTSRLWVSPHKLYMSLFISLLMNSVRIRGQL